MRVVPNQIDFIPYEVTTAINELIAGRTNAYGEITLTPGATSTVMSDYRLSKDSCLILSPATASAAAATGVYVDGYKKEECTIHHSSSSATDMTFRFIILSGGNT